MAHPRISYVWFHGEIVHNLPSIKTKPHKKGVNEKMHIHFITNFDFKWITISCALISAMWF
jgi:hypothetical protein